MTLKRHYAFSPSHPLKLKQQSDPMHPNNNFSYTLDQRLLYANSIYQTEIEATQERLMLPMPRKYHTLIRIPGFRPNDNQDYLLLIGGLFAKDHLYDSNKQKHSPASATLMYGLKSKKWEVVNATGLYSNFHIPVFYKHASVFYHLEEFQIGMVICLGGRNEFHEITNDIWTLSLVGDTYWKKMETTGKKPKPFEFARDNCGFESVPPPVVIFEDVAYCWIHQTLYALDVVNWRWNILNVDSVAYPIAERIIDLDYPALLDRKRTIQKEYEELNLQYQEKCNEMQQLKVDLTSDMDKKTSDYKKKIFACEFRIAELERKSESLQKEIEEQSKVVSLSKEHSKAMESLQQLQKSNINEYLQKIKHSEEVHMSELNDKEKHIAELRKTIENFRAQLQQNNNDKLDLQSTVSLLRDTINKKDESILELNTSINDQQSKIGTLKDQIKSLKSQVQVREDKIFQHCDDISQLNQSLNEAHQSIKAKDKILDENRILLETRLNEIKSIQNDKLSSDSNRRKLHKEYEQKIQTLKIEHLKEIQALTKDCNAKISSERAKAEATIRHSDEKSNALLKDKEIQLLDAKKLLKQQTDVSNNLCDQNKNLQETINTLNSTIHELKSQIDTQMKEFEGEKSILFERIKNLTDKIDEKSTSLLEIGKELDKLKDTSDDQSTKLSKQSDLISSLDKQNALLRQSVDEKQTLLDRNEEDISSLNRQLKELQTKFKTLLVQHKSAKEIIKELEGIHRIDVAKEKALREQIDEFENQRKLAELNDEKKNQLIDSLKRNAENLNREKKHVEKLNTMLMKMTKSGKAGNGELSLGDDTVEFE